MPSLVLNSSVFGDLFGTAAMRALFDDYATVQRYLDVETALAFVQAELGIIPQEAAQAISMAACADRIDMQHLAARTAVVGVPILPLVEQIAAMVPDGLGQWAHYGATTQDIMDTADILQYRAALNHISADLEAIAQSLVVMAGNHARTPMVGRSRSQHALPIPFGLKAAVWLSMIDRHHARLENLRPRLECISFSGAVGTLASLGDKGIATREGLAKALSLGCPDLPWHTARDAVAEMTGLLALIGGTLGKIGTDIALMMQSEIAEVREPASGTGRGRSSTMPHKRNPVGAEAMIAAGKLVRAQHGAMLDAMVQDHERGTGAWQVEWQAAPAALVALSGGLHAARELLNALEIRKDAMAASLAKSGDILLSEAVVMDLAPDLGRQRAHDLVQDCCAEVLRGEGAFLDILCAHEILGTVRTRSAYAALLESASYLGQGPDMIAQYLKRR